MSRNTCAVHEPKSVQLSAKYFKNPPNKVTTDNKSFWKLGIKLGESICKICYEKFRDRKKPLNALENTSPNDISTRVLYFE